MNLKPGTRLRSQVDTTEVIVIRPPKGDVIIACGGHPMIDQQAQPALGLTPTGDGATAMLLGKRYIIDGEDAPEFLVTKSGSVGITVDGVPVTQKEARPLPASD